MDQEQPIEARYQAQMVALAKTVDEFLNGKDNPKKVGFAILMFEFGKPNRSRMNYIGNGKREDIIVALKELVARFEGRMQDQPPKIQ
jgi:hypothetical protein